MLKSIGGRCAATTTDQYSGFTNREVRVLFAEIDQLRTEAADALASHREALHHLREALRECLPYVRAAVSRPDSIGYLDTSAERLAKQIEAALAASPDGER